MSSGSGDEHLLTTIQDQYTMAGQLISLTKKQGVSGQSVDPGKTLEKPATEKDFRTKHLIKEALMENDFLKNLSTGQVREIIDHMTLKKIAAGAYVIREGNTRTLRMLDASGGVLGVFWGVF